MDAGSCSIVFSSEADGTEKWDFSERKVQYGAIKNLGFEPSGSKLKLFPDELVLSRFSVKTISEFSLPSNAVSVIGKELELATKPNGDVEFGATYTLGDDSDGMSLLLTWKTKISDAELASLPDELHWNIISSSGVAVPATFENAKFPKSMLKVGQLKVTGSYALAKSLLGLKDGILVFAKSPRDILSDALYHIDLGDLCQNHQDYFTKSHKQQVL